ncbi:MAG: class II aldolase/adducin family protein [Fervidicoccaceae archaeon]
MSECSRIIEEVLEVSRLLVDLGLNTLRSGNVSGRCGDFIVLTPTSRWKHTLTPRDLVFYDMKRGIYIGALDPTIEHMMHVLSYRKKSDLGGVAHAHNPLATSLLETRSPEGEFEEERALRLCESSPAPPGSRELAEGVSSLADQCDIVLLPGHGLVSFGRSPLDAAERLIALEALAKRIAIIGRRK